MKYAIRMPEHAVGTAVEQRIINAILEYHEEGSSRHCLEMVRNDDRSWIKHHRLAIQIEFTS